MPHINGGETSSRDFNSRPQPSSVDNKILHNAGRESLSRFTKPRTLKFVFADTDFVVKLKTDNCKAHYDKVLNSVYT